MTELKPIRATPYPNDPVSTNTCMSTDNPHNECYMVTIPVSVLVDAKDVSQASNTARTELRKRLDSSVCVWPVVSKFEMGDSVVQEVDLTTALAHIGAVSRCGLTGLPKREIKTQKGLKR